MWRDLIHSLRVIRRYPLSSVGSCRAGAGHGANTAMFAVFHTWITKPLLPGSRAPDGALCGAARTGRASSRGVGSRRRRLAGESRSLEGLALFDRHLFRVDDEPDAEHVHGARIEAALFPLLGVAPVLGRTFSPDDDFPASPPQ